MSSFSGLLPSLWSSLLERLCLIGGAGLVFQEHVVLLAFGQVSCHLWSNFPGVAVIAKVGMVGEN